MIWNNLQIHNAEYAVQRTDGALQIFRFPQHVTAALGEGQYPYSMFVGRMTTGCELRFVCDAADLILSAEDYDGSVDIYCGDFKHKTVPLPAGKMTRVELRKLKNLTRYDLRDVKTRFSTNVWRVIFNHGFRGVIHNVEAITPMRPPLAAELPAKKLLAYGSSITHGASANDLYENAYISTVGKLLGVDVLCKGMGGSCHCEKEVADYIAGADWDVALLELAVNMVPIFSVDEFARRAAYMIEKAISTGKPVVVVSHFTHYSDLPGGEEKEKNEAYIQTLEAICKEKSCENLYYIRGREIVTDYTYLCADLIHPSTFGHFEMAHKLAQKMKDMVDIF